MKVLVDMNLSPRWVGVLNEGGIEAAHWSTLGASNAPDTEIMSFARANQFVVLTHTWISVPFLQVRTVASPVSCRYAPMI